MLYPLSYEGGDAETWQKTRHGAAIQVLQAFGAGRGWRRSVHGTRLAVSGG
jgi:hypothetical protein